MSKDLSELLWVVGVGLVAGLASGVAVRKTRPDWCRSLTKFAHHRKWWLFLIGFLFFGSLAYGSFSEGNVAWGSFAAAFSLVELACFFSVGFRSLSPEMSKKIDDWDPTKFFGR